jgi:hypothetical protein
VAVKESAKLKEDAYNSAKQKVDDVADELALKKSELQSHRAALRACEEEQKNELDSQNLAHELASERLEEEQQRAIQLAEAQAKTGGFSHLHNIPSPISPCL